MNRKQTNTACWILVATAFILTAIVMIQAQRFVDNQAQALMVLDKGSFTLMTAPVSSAEELLYVLDSRSGLLLAYAQDRNARDKRVQLLDKLSVSGEMDTIMRAGAGAAPAANNRLGR
ncbi:MAG: hypothetical protein GC159_07960 [Phycisphaera sp.]|nr:hypothetical protein [Phycisphaera sp.]